jgi:hypothetical protein
MPKGIPYPLAGYYWLTTYLHDGAPVTELWASWSCARERAQELERLGFKVEVDCYHRPRPSQDFST